MLADNDLRIVADGAITFASAVEHDTSSGSSKSSGASLGVTAQLGGKEPGHSFGEASITGSYNQASSKYSSDNITNIETIIAAGGTTTIGTPGALTIDGAIVSGDRVDINAGSLDITSRQDTSTYDSSNQSSGISVSYTPATGAVSGTANVGKGQQKGDFASVKEQAGIFAGSGGFEINVSGATNLTGAVIASEADAANNRLSTGSLSYKDIENQEKYSASQVSIGLGIGGNIGKDGDGKVATADTAEPNVPVPSTETSLGKLSATPPVALSASGSQSGTTRSAIAAGTIIVGGEAVSPLDLSRDTASANDGALTQEFDDAKRDEIDQGFTAARLLVSEAGTFLANRAREQDQEKAEAQEKREAADALYEIAGDPDAINPATNAPFTDDDRELLYGAALDLYGEAYDHQTKYDSLDSRWGAGGSYRQILTAFTAAAGSDVGTTSSTLIQNSLVNYVQQRGAGLIGELVANGDLEEGSPVHAALHAIIACGGAAGGGGDCASGALGGGLSSLLTGLFADASPDDSAEDGEAKANIIKALIAGTAAFAGLDSGSAVNSAGAAIDNNWLSSKQLAQYTKELAACNGALACLSAVELKWRWQSRKQDLATLTGVAYGVADQLVTDAVALGEAIIHPYDTLNAIKGLLIDPQARAALGTAIVSDLQKKIATIEYAFKNGQNVGDATAAGVAIGQLLVTVAGAVSGAGAGLKATATLAKFGVKVGKKVIAKVAVPKNKPTVTNRDHYAHHNAMRTDVINQLEEQGYRVADGEATFADSCGVGRCRPDIIYEAPDGTKRIIEIKTGNADLSIRQSEIFPQIRNGDAIPKGKVAERFGLQPGVPLRNQGYPDGIPIEVREFPGVSQ